MASGDHPDRQVGHHSVVPAGHRRARPGLFRPSDRQAKLGPSGRRQRRSARHAADPSPGGIRKLTTGNSGGFLPIVASRRKGTSADAPTREPCWTASRSLWSSGASSRVAPPRIRPASQTAPRRDPRSSFHRLETRHVLTARARLTATKQQGAANQTTAALRGPALGEGIGGDPEMGLPTSARHLGTCPDGGELGVPASEMMEAPPATRRRKSIFIRNVDFCIFCEYYLFM